MMDYDRTRLIQALDEAIALVERDAFHFCYEEDPEYAEVITAMRAHRQRLKERNIQDLETLRRKIASEPKTVVSVKAGLERGS